MNGMITKLNASDNYVIGKEKLVYFELVAIKSLTNKVRKYMVCPNENIIILEGATIPCIKSIEDVVNIFIRNDNIELQYILGGEQKSLLYKLK